ncbi:hypothetical protein [Brevundimonas sp. NIBR11]|uniref:hypothetical protein n=1 Tax=Brevundimonas sp. NIBR11 TaxID=3015999 RepID=UPI0022EFEE73|nr:hypothetical protein [Brevundimonas sp. NIBR11]WGM30599.1 hypothetical protein KKHFBJBL_00824 [Brevundimonas sp. NIBR11]
MLKQSIAAVIFAVLLGAASQDGGTSPWFGTWALRAQDAGDRPETLIYSDAGAGAMRMESVEAQSVIVTHFDGEPMVDIGPNSSSSALAVTATSPTSYAWTFWKDGQPFVQGLNTLAADRQSFTEVSWLADEPENRVTLIYERR